MTGKAYYNNKVQFTISRITGRSKSQGGFIQVLGLILLVAGLAAGLFLMQKSQVFRSRASSDPITFKDSAGQALPTRSGGMPYTSSAKIQVELRAPFPPKKVLGTSATSQDLDIKKGITAVGLTVDPGSNYKAADFLRDLNKNFTPATGQNGKITAINNVDSLVWGHEYDTAPEGRSSNVPIRMGEGYYVRSEADGKATITGQSPTEATLYIMRGDGTYYSRDYPVLNYIQDRDYKDVYTFISLPFLPENVQTAEQLLTWVKRQGQSQKLTFDLASVSQFLDGKITTHPLNRASNNFLLSPGRAYLISVNRITNSANQELGAAEIKLSRPAEPLSDQTPTPTKTTPSSPAGGGSTSGIVPTVVPTSVATTTPVEKTTISYKLAEDPVSLENIPVQPYTSELTVVDYEFKNKTPGIKSIFVKFVFSDGTVSDARGAQVELVAESTPTPTTSVPTTVPISAPALTPVTTPVSTTTVPAVTTTNRPSAGTTQDSMGKILGDAGILSVSPTQVKAGDKITVSWDLKVDLLTDAKVGPITPDMQGLAVSLTQGSGGAKVYRYIVDPSTGQPTNAQVPPSSQGVYDILGKMWLFMKDCEYSYNQTNGKVLSPKIGSCTYDVPAGFPGTYQFMVSPYEYQIYSNSFTIAP